jgi:hypothetical protein
VSRIRTTLTAAALTGAVVPLAAACTPRYAAERDGRRIGQAVCDLHSADTPEAAADARASIGQQIDDLAGKVALFTADERRAIQGNVADLAEHTVQGNDGLRQQDLAVLQRSVRGIAEDSGQVARAALEGIGEGLDDCVG